MPPFRIVLTDFGAPETDIELAEFRAAGLEFTFQRLDTQVPEKLIPGVAEADGLLVGFAKITRPVIEAMQHCKVISRYGIGMDMVDLAAASERGIIVANVPDYCFEEVSNHALACLLALTRNLVTENAWVHAGKWGRPAGEPMPARLSKQTVGIVGLGNIGREVARKAQAFGMRVLAHDPFVTPEKAAALGVELASLDDLLRRADFVCLHCPLIPETRHLIGAAQLAMMKPTAFLINMARGPVVDQPALYQALVAKQIAGAALDVLEQEPPAADEPLLKLDNVILLPHTASVSDEAIVQLRRDTARNVVEVLQGRLPRAIVNRAGLGLPRA
jgi:D-3-phosphoglycerate dehydrogenase